MSRFSIEYRKTSETYEFETHMTNSLSHIKFMADNFNIGDEVELLTQNIRGSIPELRRYFEICQQALDMLESKIELKHEAVDYIELNSTGTRAYKDPESDMYVSENRRFITSLNEAKKNPNVTIFLK